MIIADMILSFWINYFFMNLNKQANTLIKLEKYPKYHTSSITPPAIISILLQSNSFVMLFDDLPSNIYFYPEYVSTVL